MGLDYEKRYYSDEIKDAFNNNTPINKITAEICSLFDEEFASKEVPEDIDSFKDGDLDYIEELYQRGVANGVPGVRIVDHDEALKLEQKGEEADEKISDEFLDTPLHDTGNPWYGVLSLFLPVLGIIGAYIFKRFNYIRNYKVCKKLSIIGFCIIGAIIVLFFILLLLVRIR